MTHNMAHKMRPMHVEGRRRTNFQETFEDDYLQNGLQNILRSQIRAENAVDAQTKIGNSADAKERFGGRESIPDALVMYQNVFISIDSRYRDRTYRINDKGIIFNLGINVPSTVDGVIGLQFPLVNVCAMEIMDSIVYPKKYQSGIVYKPNNYFNEVTMLLQEIFSQSYNGPKNRYHFTFMIQTLDTVRYVLPIPYNAVFKFALPVLIDKTLTFRFYTPTDDAGLDDDIFWVQIAYTNPAKLTIVQPINTNTNTPVPHNFSSNDVISFEDFHSSSYLYDSNNPQSIVYSEKFYPVTVINATTFTIPLNFTIPALANDPNRPGSVNYINTITMQLDVILNGHYGLYYDGLQIAQPGDTFYFSNVYLSAPQSGITFNDFAVEYVTSLTGIQILEVQPAYSGFRYVMDIDSGTYPIINGILEPGIVLLFTLSQSPPVVKPPVRIFDGTRRIRFPIKFVCRV